MNNIINFSGKRLFYSIDDIDDDTATDHQTIAIDISDE